MASIRQSLSLNGNTNVAFSPDIDEEPKLVKSSKIELTEKYLEGRYHLDDLQQDDVIDKTIHYVRKNYTPSGTCLINYFFKRIPFFNWIRYYDIKKDLIKDLIAGLTIGVIHIPSAMAYSLMAGLPVVNGLYITFFSVMLYIFFGSSRHASAGVYGVISLMVNDCITRNIGILLPASLPISNTTDTSGFISNDPAEAKLMIAAALCFYTGIIMMGLGVLHLGFVTKYLSDSIVNGFTLGAAYQILVSQISVILGLKLDKINIPLALIANLIEIFQVIHKTNPATIIIAIVAMIFLYTTKTQINERFKAKLPFPLPLELVMVVGGIVISYFADFNGRWSVVIVGALPTGFPKPRLPAFSIFSNIIGDVISIAIVTYANNVSIAKLYAKKYKYEIRPNQEFLAYGIMNSVASFFGGFPGSISLARCIIFESVGGRSQVNAIFSGLLVLIIMLFLGPYFKTLPNCVLAALIIVTLKNKILEVLDIPKLWRKSRVEAVGYIVTFLGVVIFNIDIGLYVGIGFSILLFVFQSQRPRTTVLGQIPDTNLFENVQTFRDAQEINGIKIIRYEESVYFANVENFKYRIIKLSKNHPYVLADKMNLDIKMAKKNFKKVYKSVKRKNTLATLTGYRVDQNNKLDRQVNKKEIIENSKKKIVRDLEIRHIILDCSCMNYIDSQGINAIIQLHSNFKDVGINLYLSYCKDSIIDAFKKFLIQDNYDFDCIFVTTEEAVRHAQRLMDDSEEIEVIVKEDTLDKSQNEYDDNSRMKYENTRI